MQYQRDFKGVWIPKEVWLSEELSIQEKILYVEIDSLDRNDGCYATNEHFASFLGVSSSHISRLISQLQKKEIIEIKQENIKGRTRRTITTTYAKMHSRYMQNCIGGVCINAEPSINNTVNNTLTVAKATREKKVKEEKPFNFEEELIELRNSNRKDYKIISLYWKKKGFVFYNQEQFNSALVRELCAAKLLKGYTGEQIGRSIKYCQEKYPDIYTLETVSKRIADLVNKKS